MALVSKIMVALIAIEHLYILWIEMFAWTTKGKATFKSIPPELFESTKVLAANQGLYNGFLAAALIWSLFIQNMAWSYNIALFTLGCVLVAGVYGGITASRSILVKQALPALVAIVVVLVQCMCY